METLELTVAIICISLTALGFLRNQPLMLIMAGIGWVALGFMLGDAAAQPELSTALTFLGIGLSLICFLWPLTMWVRERRDRLSPEDQDYEDYRRKIEDTIRRR